ncbi:MAG: peptide/nickel transport system substrate-binding protein [Thermomicrobiales bacterium]|nr:peptide/nickel transport system substrate-binding protein [Thermomicrobiales bacterium]
MRGPVDLEAMLYNASPTTRREILKRAAGIGISAPALLALLRSHGVQDVAAASGAPTEGSVASPFQDSTPKEGGTLTVTGHQEVASLAPDDAGPTVHWVVVTQIHNALLEMDENTVFQPVLAEAAPEISADGLTYTFKLRQGVKFHDGVEFTSEDVKYTYEWYMDPANAAINAADFESVSSVEAPDPYTVVVKLKEVYAPFIARVATKFIMPAKYHAQIGTDGYKAKPVGTGPFKLKEWRAAEFTELEAFADHFRGRPHVNVFREEIVPEASVRAIGLETGEADSAVWPLTPEDNLRLADDANFVTFITSSTAINHFPINNKNPKLADKRVRQAMMYAIDRQTVIDEIFSGTAQIATSNLSPALAQYYNPDVPQYTFDTAKAAALLDEAGWTLGGDGIREKDGEKLSFTCTTITGDQTRRPEAELVQQYLSKVGIDMQLEEAPVATILEKLRKAEMDAALFNWTYGGDYYDPDDGGTLHSTGASNFSHYSNARVDELLTAGLRAVDPEERAAAYKEIQAIVADEVPFIFMMFWNWYNIFNARVKGLPESAKSGDNIYAKAFQFWIDEG